MPFPINSVPTLRHLKPSASSTLQLYDLRPHPSTTTHRKPPKPPPERPDDLNKPPQSRLSPQHPPAPITVRPDYNTTVHPLVVTLTSASATIPKLPSKFLLRSHPVSSDLPSVFSPPKFTRPAAVPPAWPENTSDRTTSASSSPHLRSCRSQHFDPPHRWTPHRWTPARPAPYWKPPWRRPRRRRPQA